MLHTAMSVLNQSSEEQVECPLCMEPLEVDDLYFFPCTCGYQICRFCWHRIRTDENGLCPACRKAYPEDPADFKPLTQEAVAKLKAEKRQKDQQKKQRNTENRKHLANVRVVQKNLVFVVGLPVRLADPEMLKKHEYFGKFGKIHKVVINQSTSYAGSQGPSASAYVTYQKSDDALRAIQTVNNIAVDGRTVKTSLGTTKYCSHFIKNQPCPKVDCMYLHELGDAEASFTKEQMQQGKHQEYEKKLHEQLLASTINRKPTPSPPTVPIPVQNQNKEAWPTLHPNHQNSAGESPSSSPTDSINCPINGIKNELSRNSLRNKSRNNTEDNRKHDDLRNGILRDCYSNPLDSPGSNSYNHSPPEVHTSDGEQEEMCHPEEHPSLFSEIKSDILNCEKSSEYSNYHQPDLREFANYNKELGSAFIQNHSNPGNGSVVDKQSDWHQVIGSPNIQEVITKVHPPETWTNKLCFSQTPDDSVLSRDDDLGFDPFHETQKALAEMIEKEEQHRFQPTKLLNKHHNNRLNSCSKLLEGLRLGSTVPHSRPPPPGFTSTPNHMNAFGLGIPRTGSKLLQYIHPTIAFSPSHQTSSAAWDWPSLDPAIVTSAQHCDLFPGNPPPGFSLRQTLDNL
ncbi:CCR4-NOT transcription complex subunit 4 isoform X2 [Cimex lectularius]|uniref:CCR4-NOT transcription complex subunit 4 n=1 Tax=Cimex lectularius TaxID=79782 RepID=A0A8I6SKN3_CIMLE|nr:CCR4-NOT transcription complex subunit 4 isoform X2 [Cimex lectularius]